MTRFDLPTLRDWAGRALGAFLTGLLFLLPFILTVILFDWVVGYVAAAVGPDSFIGGAITGGGSVIVGDGGRTLAFWIGLLLVLVAIGVFGLFVQTRFRKRLEDGFDRFIDRVPVLRSVYRPIAQLVRFMQPKDGNQLSSMRPVAVRFGQGADTLALLVSPDTYEIAGEQRMLILIPTAPVPVGGALLFVPPASVHEVSLPIEDLLKFYVSMGATLPADRRLSPP